MKVIRRSSKQAIVISELNYLMVKHNQSINNKEIVFNRVNDAFRRGCSPAKGFAIGLKDARYLIERGLYPMSKLHTIKTIHEFNQIVARENTVVDFYRPGCAVCESIVPKLAQAAIDYPHYVFIKVDIEANPDIAYLFGVQTVPTFAVFEKNKLQLLDSGTTALQFIENNIKATLPKSNPPYWQTFDPNC